MAFGVDATRLAGQIVQRHLAAKGCIDHRFVSAGQAGARFRRAPRSYSYECQ
jgi:hypothetical protein